MRGLNYWKKRFDRIDLDLEDGVKKIVADFLDELKQELLPIHYFKPAASIYGKRGIADFIVCRDGAFLAIETKAPTKGEKGQTPMQKKFMGDIERGHGIYILVYNWKTFRDLICYIFPNARMRFQIFGDF